MRRAEPAGIRGGDPASPPSGEIQTRRRPRIVGVLALAFVLLSLAASLITPFVLQRGIDRIRAEVDGGADPARTLVTGIQFSLPGRCPRCAAT